MNKRKLRRVAIVALVLVLLCNTLGVQASTKKDDPTVIVKDYGSLYTAIAEAKDNEVSTVNAPESTTEPQRSPNWIEYITVIFLAILVGLEIKDKLHKEK